jgi:NAD(P)-dependent dehydrogenase (short-subunit alcohol dehydrogenase family)
MGKLEGKVAFITGAARGQGRSHAVRLAEEGADIIAVDICAPIASMNYPNASPEDLEQTVKEVEATGRKIIARKGDVRLREQLAEVLEEGIKAFGHLDVVVANAGICPGRDETLCSGFVDATDVDLIGAMNTVAVSLPHLSAGASIIVTGSTAGMIKGLGQADRHPLRRGPGAPAGREHDPDERDPPDQLRHAPVAQHRRLPGLPAGPGEPDA